MKIATSLLQRGYFFFYDMFSNFSLCHLVVSESWDDDNPLHWLGSSASTIWLTYIFGKTSAVILNWKDVIRCHIVEPLTSLYVSMLFLEISWYSLLQNSFSSPTNSSHIPIFWTSLFFFSSIFSRNMEDEYSCPMLCTSVMLEFFCLWKSVFRYVFFFP